MLLCIWKLTEKSIRRFRSKLKNEILKDYLVNKTIDIDKIIDDFYGYVYMITKNGASIYITDEDIEEIISDVFVALWKNGRKLSEGTELKPYIAGITKNIIKNKYRKSELKFDLSEYENRLISNNDLEKITEENDQNDIIKSTLKELKSQEYQVFIMFYSEGKTVKEIAKILNFSESKVKVVLHRVRKKIKTNLEDGGYSYGK